MKLTTKLFTITSFIMMMSFNTQQLFAQSVDYKHKIEFSEEEDTEKDFNAIKVYQDVELEKRVVEEKTTEASALDKLLEKNRLRYRNRRTESNNKCFKDIEEHCGS